MSFSTMLLLMAFVISASAGVNAVKQACYKATSSVDPKPVFSWQGGNSDFQQVFNPSWIEANSDGSVKSGILVRTQNCSNCGLDTDKVRCCGCNMQSANDSLQKRSILTFSPLGPAGDGAQVGAPSFDPLTKASIVFEPIDQPPLNDDFRGTEDPRVAFDKSTGLYYMFYTCYHKVTDYSLCLASTKNPTISTGWTRHGAPFAGAHKSGALLIRDSPPHYLISGAGQIHISNSTDLLSWTLGPPFITETSWGNPNVEAGPPPLLLADGNYVFFHNSWGGKNVPQPGYQPSWVVLNGTNPNHILARAPQPLWSPNDYPWMAGDVKGEMCNVPQVSFLEAAHIVDDKADTFRCYYGGADAVLGTATVTFERVAGVDCE